MVRVAVGGTFEFLHLGHRTVLTHACRLASDGELVIGITSDRFASLKDRHVASFADRYKQVLNLISSFDVNATVVQLDDPFGPALTEDFDYIIVSIETLPNAERLNKLREEKGLDKIKVVCVDYVLAFDGKPISSTRIAKGEIDRWGKNSW
ncbi:phosphopantetheine adenylyltransferase [Methanosarcinales archaeon ex4572_44]|nr:MAG: phosphopantetheine adenylyltransferase [Methanosarcinales archaeon ex4484_138]PHP46012.1 MAG: phosphopantetheine adenylyltransferase [Methanosarcinales archaeon ex4572_44]RLG27377.1 MAG: phosphopantetheine adenylyltransferase [Methanosarcinales archaeon]RLG28319.1 MAG: phosphopantetheine adenylyltransferase [Methanosarcinales archaeon]HHI30092.1 phosphopantetheine adenylyltransferase [Candidatus Methanoperedenaceae archaeon]